MIAVQDSAQHSCAIDASSAHGYLASALVGDGKCGTSGKPWLFRITSSQTLNLTLHDFSSPAEANLRSHESLHVNAESCNVYAITKTSDKTNRVCGDVSRQHFVMTSRGQDVEVRMFPGNLKKRYFLLEYKSKGHDKRMQCISSSTRMMRIEIFHLRVHVAYKVMLYM